MLSAGSLFTGRGWGRWFGIVAIIVNMIVQIAWFPAYPLWSLVAIGLGVAVLWALTAGWQEAKADLRSCLDRAHPIAPAARCICAAGRPR